MINTRTAAHTLIPSWAVDRSFWPEKNNLYYSFHRYENLHTYVKSKIKWGNCLDIFFNFLHRKRVIHRKLQSGHYDRTALLGMRVSLTVITYLQKRNILQNYAINHTIKSPKKLLHNIK